MSSTKAERSHPASEATGGTQEEPPHVQGQGRCPRPRATARRSNPTPEARVATGSSNPMPKARGGGREGQCHIQGVVAVQVQEGLEEPSHVEGQEGRW